MQISGKFDVDGSGNVDFKEEDGIDYAPVTVQLPGGERVPFLFTIKELQAKVHPFCVTRWHLATGGPYVRPHSVCWCMMMSSPQPWYAATAAFDRKEF